MKYGDILKKSWKLTRKYKWLWVYGMILTVLGSFGSSGGGSNSSSFLKNLPKDIPKDLPKDIPQKTVYVLGQATNTIKEWFLNIPISTWFIIVTISIVFLIAWSFFVWIVKSWAKAGLISGLNDANNNLTPTLFSTSPKGLTKIKSFLVFDLITMAATFAVILFMGLFAGVTFLLVSAFPDLKVIFIIIGVIILVFTLAVLIIVMSMIGIYADRLIVLFNYSPIAAWKKGLSMSRGNFLPTFFMSSINSIIGCSIGCVSNILLLIVLGIPGLIILMPVISKSSTSSSPLTIIGMLFLFMLYIYANYLVNVVFTVFKFSNWNLFFQKILEKKKY